MNKAILEITMKVAGANRPKAGEIYAKYKMPFLATVPGAETKDLLVRDEDVQVIHTFESRAWAEKYLASQMFGVDVVTELKPLLAAEPEIRIYERQ
jgi:hypothetical protein